MGSTPTSDAKIPEKKVTALNNLPYTWISWRKSMTLHLRPEIAAGLETLANAQGLSVEDYLKQLVERELSLNAPQSSPGSRLSPKEWAHQFEEWADSFPEAPPIPDEALRRENLYPDRS